MILEDCRVLLVFHPVKLMMLILRLVMGWGHCEAKVKLCGVSEEAAGEGEEKGRTKE